MVVAPLGTATPHGSVKLRADFLTVEIDGNQFSQFLCVPVLPTVACWRLLHKGTDLVDGTLEFARGQCAVSAHARRMTAPAISQYLSGFQEAAL